MCIISLAQNHLSKEKESQTIVWPMRLYRFSIWTRNDFSYINEKHFVFSFNKRFSLKKLFSKPNIFAISIQGFWKYHEYNDILFDLKTSPFANCIKIYSAKNYKISREIFLHKSSSNGNGTWYPRVIKIYLNIFLGKLQYSKTYFFWFNETIQLFYTTFLLSFSFVRTNLPSAVFLCMTSRKLEQGLSGRYYGLHQKLSKP